MKYLLRYSILKETFLSFIYLHLCLCCATLPFFAWWGIPQSYLSPLGNVLFSPFLTAFLFVSTLIFFSVLIGIPSSYLCILLDQITHIWLKVLSWGPQNPFIASVKPPIWLAISIPIISLYCAVKLPYRKEYKCFLIGALLCFYYGTLSLWHTPKTLITPIATPFNSQIHMIFHQGETTIIDPGAIGKQISAISWTEFTLIPEIIKKTGKPIVHHWIMLKPGKLAFLSLKNAAYKIQICHAYVPWWSGIIKKSAFTAYKEMVLSIKRNHGSIHRIHRKPSIVNSLTIEPLQELRSYHEAQFYRYRVHGIIDNKAISIYAP